jgi:hypothetical protein
MVISPVTFTTNEVGLVRQSGCGEVSLRERSLSAGRTPECDPVRKDEDARLSAIRRACESAHRPFGQGRALPSGRCARDAGRATIRSMDLIGPLALFLLAFVVVVRDPDERD